MNYYDEYDHYSKNDFDCRYDNAWEWQYYLCARGRYDNRHDEHNDNRRDYRGQNDYNDWQHTDRCRCCACRCQPDPKPCHDYDKPERKECCTLCDCLNRLFGCGCRRR